MAKYLTILTLSFLILLTFPTQAWAPIGQPVPVVPVEAVPEPEPVQPDPDVELLAQIIQAEAREECLEGQVAVGAVVVNRVRDDRFPGTIRGVIYQPRQFTPVSRGLPMATDRARAAARLALEGVNPVGDAVYFYNPRTARDGWIRTRPVVTEIGGHRFAK